MRTQTIIRLLAFLSLVPSLGWAQQPTPQRLEKDRPIERTIGGAASHNYALRLKKGQFCYAEVDQRGVDVVVRVFAPNGKRLQEIDSPNGTQGPEPMTLIADSTGDYRIEVSPLEPNAPVGHYVVSIIALRPAATSASGKIDQLLVAWDKPGSPGAAVAVIQNDKIVFKKGYGYANLEYDVPITPATVFHVASVSKQFTAFCIALLAKAGKLSLDDDIRLYLPEMHDFGKKITIQHLIHHTSGLRDQWELLAMAGWRLDDVITTDHILRMMWRARELNFNPGDEELYCNTGYTLLAEIVSRVSKKSFRAFADSAIFKPLGMTNTHVHDSHEMIVKNRAYSYVSSPEGGFRLAALNYATAGATSLFTTVEDLAKWSNNFDQPIVGGPEVIRQMHERFTLNNGQTINYAFGLGLNTYKGLQRIGHSGGDAAFRSHLVRFPDQKFAVAILCNTNAINPSRLSEQIAEIYLANQMPATPASNHQPQPAEAQVDTTLLRKYTGMFQLRPGWILTITLEDGKLMTQATGEGKFPMRAETPTRFFVAAYQAAVIFKPDPQNNVDTIEYRNMKAPRVFAFSPSATELEAFTGEFYSEELETSYRLKVQDGKLVALHQRNDMVSLTPTVTDQFAGNQWWFRGVQFQRHAQGAIAGFTITGGRVRYLRFVKRA